MNKKELDLLGLGAAMAHRRGSAQHVHHRTEIHEHRAPTDKSVALLKEMEEKAEAKLIGSLQIGDNKVNCVVQSYASGADYRFVLRAVFDVNGQRMTAEAEMLGLSCSEPTQQQKLLGELRDNIAKELAKTMLSQTFDQIDARRLFGGMR